MLRHGRPWRYADDRARWWANQYKTGNPAACKAVEAMTTLAIERS